MNPGKLCISVAADTAEKLIDKIERARPMADIIEVRFDSSHRSAVSQIRDLKLEIPVIATFRSDSKEDRVEFWNNDNSKFWACDLEEDVLNEVRNCQRRIASFHDHSGSPGDLEAIYERIAASSSDVVKIAVTAHDVTDAIPVWKLLERARYDGRELIPIAMGEAGEWTRILGPAHGAFLTYTSLDAGEETAAGQFTARDMLDVYRIHEIDRETRIYGVIGDPVSHSMSPIMQNAAFAATGENAVFLPLMVKDLDAFMTRMVKSSTREVDLNFAGFSVTMPHKLSIIRHLDPIDPVADAIGAVNTVKIDGDGRLTGFNTDACGFMIPLKERLGYIGDLRFAVIGAGGAARAVVHALKKEQASPTIFVRDTPKTAWFAEHSVDIKPISDLKLAASKYDVLVNATPVGMKGPTEVETFLTADELSGVRLVYDLVTRSDDTPLIRVAKAAGVSFISGLEMLIAQGARQFEIWTGREAPVDRMRSAITDRTGG